MPPYKTDTALRRGAACLSCRKRKLKCDGIRPVCGQCSRMNRNHSCKYDDAQQKSRTQQLKEQLATLERRLQELETRPSPQSSSSSDSDPGSPPIFEPFGDGLLSAHSDSSSPSPPSSLSSPAGFEHPFVLHHLESSSLQSDGSPLSCSILEPVGHWDPIDLLPSSERRQLLTLFMYHSHQCWFYASMDRFFLESTQHLANDPHPALINAMYLLACHFAQSPDYAEFEPAFFLQTQREINSALDNCDRLPDIVQASSLLAIYLYMKNRVMEGYRHAFSAIRLALAIGLHRICSSDIISEVRHGHGIPSPVIPIPPPCDATELSDRICAFWQVFMVDRCWSVANGLPPALPSKDTIHYHILTPWPSSVKWAENQMAEPPLQALLEGSEHADPECSYMPALKAKAAALYELASRSKTELDDWNHLLAESAIHRFLTTIPALPDRDYIVVQTMVYASFIHLQQPAYFDSRAFNAGRSMVRLIDQLGDVDYPSLDPIIGVCWFAAAEMFIQALTSSTLSGYIPMTNPNGDNCNVCLNVLHDALIKLSTYSPMAANLVMKIDISSLSIGMIL